MTDAAPPPDMPVPPNLPDRISGGDVRPGVILNGIYRVERAVARGGMGQVFEGTNVELDERVAIKVVHRHLASDGKVQAMFRKEARILTQLSHPAIAHYRVLARDPVVDVTYIVTDFIDGRPLLDLLNGQPASVADIQALGRRLAEGLEAAHAAGAVHRDISPDNILIGKGGIDKAKIIDFGIARDLAVGAETVIGDGFAGKIGYVAPEQFGDFGRSIGPWTDVYSLALVLMAFARGKAPDMGSSLAEAVEKRRGKPDLTDMPDILRPLLTRMLTPDPRQRIGTMADVRREMDRIAQPQSGPGKAPDKRRGGNSRAAKGLWTRWTQSRRKPAASAQVPVPPGELTVFAPVDGPAPQVRAAPQMSAGHNGNKPEKRGGPAKGRARTFWTRRHAILMVLALLVASTAAVLLTRDKRIDPAPAESATLPPAVPNVASLVEVASPELACSWLDWSARQDDGRALLLQGAANDPTSASEAALQSVQTMDLGAATVDSTGVVRIDDAQCAAVDALRKFRAIDTHTVPTLRAAQAGFELAKDVQGCPSGIHARPVLTAAPANPSNEFALLAVLPSGRVRLLSASRDDLKKLAQRYPDRFGELQDGATRITLCEKERGVMGVAMIEAPQQPSLNLPQGRDVAPGPDWTASLVKAGRSQGWSVRMAWITLNDAQADPIGEAKMNARSVTAPTNRDGGARPLTNTPYMEPAAQANSIQAPQPATPSSDAAACRRYDGHWRENGYASLSACVARIFTDCLVNAGQWGDVALRRYNGRVEAMGGRFSRWSRVGKDQCARRTGRAGAAEPGKGLERIY